MFRRTKAGAEPADDESDDEADHDGTDYGTDYDTDDQYDDGDSDGYDDDDGDAVDVPAPRRPPNAADDDPDLKPSTMRGSEVMYGYLVALELVVVSVLNLTITHGPGAPTGPEHLLGQSITSRQLSVVGLVVSVALVGVVQVRHRFVVPFAAIVAAFFVTLPKVPTSLSVTHFIALVVPVVYAFVLTGRQRKATAARVRSGRSASAQGKLTPAQRRAEAAESRRARKQKATPTGPKPNRRYTPPKAKRPRR